MKVFLVVSEISNGSAGLGVAPGLTISGLALVGIMCASSVSVLPNISTLITNDFFQNQKYDILN